MIEWYTATTQCGLTLRLPLAVVTSWGEAEPDSSEPESFALPDAEVPCHCTSH